MAKTANMEEYIRAHLKHRQLQILVALDNLRHVGKVAASMNVTQPAISKTLAELETGLGLKLFERTARGVTPTLYGECLIRHARAMFAELGQARDELRYLVSGTAGRITVGTLSDTLYMLVPKSVALLKRRSPETEIILREGNFDSLLTELWLEKLDLIVGRLPDDRFPRYLKRTILSESPLRIVVGAQHPLARRKRVQWSDLAGYPWVLPHVGSLLREPIERAFSRHGIAIPTNRMETSSISAICTYLQATDAIGAIDGDVSSHYQGLGLIAVLPISFSERAPSVGVAWSEQRGLSSGAKLLVECLQATVSARES
jgi:DNA-binding transcriptional LysR family regulator